MKTFVLLGTDGCELCETAEEVICDVLEANPNVLTYIVLEKFDITKSDDLMDCYAEKIPVLLCKETQKELNWPFDQQGFADFLNRNIN